MSRKARIETRIAPGARRAILRACRVVALGCALWAPLSLTAQDEWVARDKALHFGASALIAAGAYGVAAIALPCRPARVAVGSGVALIAGVGKEVHDRSSDGVASWKDFAWDVLGTAVGATVAALVDGPDDCPSSLRAGGSSAAQTVLPATWSARPGPSAHPGSAIMGGSEPTEPPPIPYRWIRFRSGVDRPPTLPRPFLPGAGAVLVTLPRESRPSHGR